MNELLTVREVAEALHLHETTIRRYIRDGKLASVRIGRNVRVPRAALDEFISSQAEPGAGESGVLREPAAAYHTAASPRPVVPRSALVARVTDDLATLDESDLNQVFRFVADLKARREEQERKALARRITENALRRAQTDTRPLAEIRKELGILIEEIRQEAIAKGVAFEGEYTGD